MGSCSNVDVGDDDGGGGGGGSVDCVASGRPGNTLTHTHTERKKKNRGISI